MHSVSSRKRPFPAKKASARTAASSSNHMMLCTIALALLVSPFPVASFGIASSRAPNSHADLLTISRGKTSLSVSTLAPPPHHLEWLQSQEDKERKLEKKQQQQQPHNLILKSSTAQASFSKGTAVLPLTLFTPPQDTLAATNQGSDTTATSAKEAWAASFTTVEALRDTFGRNRNPLWGDLDASTTRRLYKTLLPRALLELYHCHGASSEDLAPLAFRARVAAKKYARERCELPARLAATMFDGARQFCKYGTFSGSGISYPQLWEKYATQIMQEEDFEISEHDLTSKVCYKILEKACETNKKVDSMFLTDHQQADLQEVTLKLEQDVYDLLDDNHRGSGENRDKKKWSIRRYKILRTLLSIRRQMEGMAYTERDDDLAMMSVLEDAVQD